MKNIVFVLILLTSFNSHTQNFNNIYSDVMKIQQNSYADVNELYNEIVKPTYNDEEKVYAIAKYITENISYGKRAKFPLSTINSREGVCQDYSELFIALCDIAEIKNYYVSGEGRTSVSDIGFYNSNHSWNVVEINNVFQIFDLTWAAGYVDGNNVFVNSFNPFYFNPSPSLFILNHFPDEKKWQLLNNPVTKNQYINQPTYDQSIYNLSLKTGIVRDNNFQISFSSDSEFHSASIYKWSLNEYGSVSGIDIPLIKSGNNYKLNIRESINGAYRYQISLWSYIKKTELSSESVSSSIKFKLITPEFRVDKPTNYNKRDPYSLIESYFYIFHNSDLSFFKELNQTSNLNSLKQIRYYSSLKNSLSDWFGDYRNYYVNLRNGDIYYPIENFQIILTNSDDGYVFKEIKRETLKIGKSGYGVKELQIKLGINPTGFFDKKLETIIQSFQKNNNLKPDGIVGNITYNILGM